jgi:hypothetical protein
MTDVQLELAYAELKSRRGAVIEAYVKNNLWKLRCYIKEEDVVGTVYHLGWFWKRGTMSYAKLPYGTRFRVFLQCACINDNLADTILSHYKNIFLRNRDVYIYKLLE